MKKILLFLMIMITTVSCKRETPSSGILLEEIRVEEDHTYHFIIKNNREYFLRKDNGEEIPYNKLKIKDKVIFDDWLNESNIGEKTIKNEEDEA